MYCSGLFDLAKSAARRDLGEGEHSTLSAEILYRLSELEDRVESNSAPQIPMIDALERMYAQVDTLGAPSRFKGEESLKKRWERKYSRCFPATRGPPRSRLNAAIGTRKQLTGTRPSQAGRRHSSFSSSASPQNPPRGRWPGRARRWDRAEGVR